MPRRKRTDAGGNVGAEKKQRGGQAVAESNNYYETSCCPISTLPPFDDSSSVTRRSSNASTTMTSTIPVWELPDTMLYEIAQYCAPPAQRASFLCCKIASLCKASHQRIMNETTSAGIWNAVLKGDYGVSNSNSSENHGTNNRRRSCKRLRRSPVDQVKDAHKLMKDNTEIAYYYLWELSSSSNNNSASKSSKNGLTRINLVRILNTYGPQLMYNKTMSSGGTFLVEVCRCRNAKSATVVLHCVQELVERRAALVNKATNESNSCTLTAICVAAVRGMPKVVQYLLSKGAATDRKCTGRFRLHTNPKRSLRCNNLTPLEFAEAMLKAEVEEGAKNTELRDLKSCIKLLQDTRKRDSMP